MLFNSINLWQKYGDLVTKYMADIEKNLTATNMQKIAAHCAGAVKLLHENFTRTMDGIADSSYSEEHLLDNVLKLIAVQFDNCVTCIITTEYDHRESCASNLHDLYSHVNSTITLFVNNNMQKIRKYLTARFTQFDMDTTCVNLGRPVDDTHFNDMWDQAIIMFKMHMKEQWALSGVGPDSQVAKEVHEAQLTYMSSNRSIYEKRNAEAFETLLRQVHSQSLQKYIDKLNEVSIQKPTSIEILTDGHQLAHEGALTHFRRTCPAESASIACRNKLNELQNSLKLRLAEDIESNARLLKLRVNDPLDLVARKIAEDISSHLYLYIIFDHFVSLRCDLALTDAIPSPQLRASVCSIFLKDAQAKYASPIMVCFLLETCGIIAAIFILVKLITKH
jgi:hypothetical protein